MKQRSLQVRLVLLAAGGSLVALVIAGIVISGLLRQFVEDTFDTGLNATMVALMANTEFEEDTGRLRVDAAVADPRFEQPFSGWYWQISDESRVLIRSSSLWTSDLGARAGEPSGTILRRLAEGPEAQQLLILARDFTVPGGTGRLRVSAAMPVAEVEAEIAGIVWPLIISLGLLGLGLCLAIALQVRLGLTPLRALGANLSRIEAGTLTQLPVQPYAEIAPVAGQMNRLLAHSQHTIERARTHVGNLAHGLKTPLSVLNSELDKPGGAERDAAMRAASSQMDRMVSHHLRRARTAASVGIAGARTPVGAVLEDLLVVFKAIHADRSLAIAITAPPGMVFAGERQDLEELLGNLIDNACKWARRDVVVEVTQPTPAMLEISIADDGPGMSAAQREQAVQRGRRFDESKPGAGLGLSIVTDLAGLYGGGLSIDTAPEGGTLVRLTLPSAPG